MEFEPKNAQIYLKDNLVKVDQSKNGQKINIKMTEKKILNSKYDFDKDKIKIKIKFESLTPEIKTENLRKSQQIANKFIDKNLVFDFLDQKFATDRNLRASWLIFNKTDVKIDNQKFNNYVNQKINPHVYLASVPTVIKSVDLKEVERKNGTKGRAINYQQLTKAINNNLGNNQTVIKISYYAVNPKIQRINNYSHSLPGLQAYLNKLGENENIAVSFYKLNSPQWRAGVNVWKSDAAASTYKLFVAMKVLEEIDNGSLKKTDSFAGKTIETCLYDMIVYSRNKCSEAWLKQWRPRNFDNYLYSKGFSRATTANSTLFFKNSAADLEKILLGLNNKTLFSNNGADQLLYLMKKQVHRRGIPAGTNAIVADKVGFFGGYLHDAAIVYHPRGAYILVIKTKGQTWNKIAQITRQIEAIVYP